MLPPRRSNPLGKAIRGKSIGKVRNAEAHTAPTKYGMGDFYGTGVRAPLGKIRDDTMGLKPVKGKKMTTPPKKLA